MTPPEEPAQAFPRRFTALFVVLGLGLVVMGIVLWLPARNGPSTANSDLGLALVGGGLAISAGFIVARTVFMAERRFDATLRASDAARHRDALKQTLSLTPSLVGVDLGGKDLFGAFLRKKDMRFANLKKARLSSADLSEAKLHDAILNGADLMGCDLRGGELTGADLRDACLDYATLDGATFFRADLRGATLRKASLAGVSFVDSRLAGTNMSDARGERIDFVDATFDVDTKWPNGGSKPAGVHWKFKPDAAE